MTVRRLVILLGGLRVGHIDRHGDGRLTFVYDAMWRDGPTSTAPVAVAPAVGSTA